MAQAAGRRTLAAVCLVTRRAHLLKALSSWASLLAVVLAMQFYASRGMLDGGKAPGLRGTLVNGANFAGLDALPKPAVIYFWASWCGVCRVMQDTVRELGAEEPLITVATQSGDAASVRDYMTAHQLGMRTILDEDGSLGKVYGIRGVPALFIIDRDTKIRFATTGYTSGLGIRLRLWLAGY